MNKRYPSIISTFLLASAATLALAAPGQAQKSTPVIVAEAKIETLQDRIEVLGTLRANETVEITATITDTITVIHFDDGQRVAAGDILIEMTSLEEHAQLEEELSNVAEARKQFDRLAPLVKKGAASQTLLDQRVRELATAQARFKAIESRLQDRLILAPFSGMVGLRNISPGALVEPGDVITTLDDVSVMKLDFTVPTVHLAALNSGASIQARSPAFKEQVFSGTVKSINSRIDPVSRSIVARAIIDNPDGKLKPGLLMTVELLNNTRQGVVIPEEALIPSGRANYVMVVDQSISPLKVQRRNVQIGMRLFGSVEIIEGLEAGELVVTHGNTRIRPDQDVTILATDKGGAPLKNLLSGESEGQPQ
ncbi:MAG: efflux RND transporter periplasmic adaptor subunit [Desulfuromusa sp.]|nr:efflux RND transporter periplasmic adaptor subunit [Desulfuromusa sp.]